MRMLALVALVLLGGCGDDDTGGGASGADMHVPGGGVDMATAAVDMACVFRGFPGFFGTNQTLQTFDCSCGCNIDRFDNNLLNTEWGASTSAGATFTPMQNVGLGVSLTSSGGMLAQGGLASEGPIAQFYLQGDFDVLVDYDFGDVPPPGEAHLVLGVRNPGALNGIAQYEVARVHRDSGDDYETVLGGIDQRLPTTATHGTLRLTRQGTTLRSFADGQMVSTRVGADNPRLTLTLAATLQGCDSVDGGASSCGYTPRWHLLRMGSGTLVNQP